MSPETALQAAILAALSADPEMIEFVGDPPRVFDEAPRETAFPFLTIGNVQTLSNAGVEHASLEHGVTVHVWSRYGGRSEAQAILAAARRVLEGGALDVSGRTVTLAIVTLVDAFRVGDGRTTQGLLRLKVHTEPH